MDFVKNYTWKLFIGSKVPEINLGTCFKICFGINIFMISWSEIFIVMKSM